MNPQFDTIVSAKAYQTLVDLVYEHSRIQLGADKHALLTNRLRRRLEANGLTSYDAYCDLLKSPAGQEEVSHLVDYISTNHTRFYRESDHFAYLVRDILPDLVPRLQKRNAPCRIWSAAVSSGEEAYTLAIELSEFMLAWQIPWQVYATDISKRILEKARRGIYKIEALDPIPEELKKRYFQKGVGRREGYCRVKPELGQNIIFEHANLFQANYPVYPVLDVIFCRNVMIYFDVASRTQLLSRLTAHLAPGGHLFVGKAESLFGVSHGLKMVQQGIYRKP
jgi:chemotaxis protein methyltransferase CheR